MQAGGALCFPSLISDISSSCPSPLMCLQARMRRWSLSDSMLVLTRVSSNPAASTPARTMSGLPGSWSRTPPKKVRPGAGGAWGCLFQASTAASACRWVHCSLFCGQAQVVGSNKLSFLHTGATEPPTPHYNNSILCDTVMLSHLHFLSNAATDFPGMKDGLALLKVWLNQRQLSKVHPVPRWALLTWLTCLWPALLPRAEGRCFGPGGWGGGLWLCFELC